MKAYRQIFHRCIVMGLGGAMLLTACSEQAPEPSVKNESFQKKLLTQLIKAKPGDVITIPEGRHVIDRALSLNVSNVVIKGVGKDKSVLSFKGQKQGAEGLIVTADNIVLENFAVEDTKGDGIKVNECNHLTVRDVRVEWTNGPDTKNGAYGLYPVQCENVLIEKSVVIGASDAGIYVGQSRDVIVRHNRAEYNVAGIEIENTIGADVYENVATNNTGGILVFNMPNLPQPGHSTRIYNNQVFANNTSNFAPEGAAVSGVPAGSGVIINSNDKVEIFENDISENKTANIIISSYFSAGYYSEKSTAKDFDPYPETIFIYKNRFSGGGDSPDHLELKALKVAQFGFNGRLPDILWDGIVNSEKISEGKLKKEYAICIDNDTAGIINVDAGNNYKNISTDIKPHQCVHDKLPQVSLQRGS
ncbi:parallel beta-helix domain-containing protein [Pleionea sp. CnH1-48]|uniref:parallel beta-helix domain-containing protein n=1 Tax=Pleionea sp. CnH1-48 TaxID=2954494 RepID=UPI002097A18B|nr:parallel beta-helix domain-containing protein [Pleionea sp. CnH1-48]MCO7227438.1 right-handed parallel beta-helix repeat-containing protein [Pleionea sp. CnH1-48]